MTDRLDRLPASLTMVAVDLIQACPIQGRVNVSIDLVQRLSDSMKAGRYEPVLEVEPATSHDRFRLPSGRWLRRSAGHETSGDCVATQRVPFHACD